MGMTTIENGKSSADNLREIDWVKKQTTDALNSLSTDLASNFYEKSTDMKEVSYKMDVVKKYLDSIKDKDWWELTEKNSWAWIMAVQIALESQGYDVGRIDWVFWNATWNAVRKFQGDNGLKVDGAPGKNTIKKLLEKLWDVSSKEQWEGEKKDWEGEKKDWEGEKKDWEGEKKDWEGEKEDWGGEKKNIMLNEDYPKYLYTWDVDSDWKPNWKWSVEFKVWKKVNKFEWVWENWRIVECTSYGNTIKIKYNTEWDAIFETSSWKTLKVENKNINHVGRTASIINYIFKVVWDSGKKFEKFYYIASGAHAGLHVKYADDSQKRVLKSAHFAMKIDYSEPLTDRLNEYSKEVIK